MKRIILFFILISTNCYSQNWTQNQKITPNIRHGSSYFGFKVLLKDDIIYSGAYEEGYDADNQNNLLNAGSIYVFRKENNNWVQQQKIVPSDRLSQDEFGRDVKIFGEHLFVTSKKRYGSQYYVGAVYVFKKNSLGDWTQIQKIVPQNLIAYAEFGNRIAVNSNILTIGSSASYNTQVYEYNSGFEQWEYKQELLFPNNGNSYNTNISIDADKIFVGKRNQQINGMSNVGQLNIYKKNISINEWEIFQTINPPTIQSNLDFGSNVFAKNNYLFVSAVNSSNFYIYKLNNVTNYYELIQTFNNGAPKFGSEVSMDNNVLVVSASGASNEIASSGGAAYIYTLQNDIWNFTQKIYNNDSHPYDGFGYGVSIDNNTIVVGSPDHDFDTNGNNVITSAGAAYIFKNDNTLSTVEVENNHFIKIFPNPFSESISIQSNFDYQNVSIEIYDMSGKKIFHKKCESLINNALDLAFLAKAIYQIKILSNSKVVSSQKIIKK